MARYKVQATIWVATQRGPEPTPEQVGEALKRLLGSDTMTVSVDRPDGGFEAATLACEEVEGNVQVIE
jgi:hypothetical protein